MDLEAFPDELLLHVFSHLSDGATLLDSVAVVCKRWYRLSRDPQAWTGVRVDCPADLDDAGTRRLARVVLHGPVLGSLALRGRPSPWMQSALRRNESLELRDALDVLWKDADEAGLAALLLDLVWRSRRHLRYVAQFRLKDDSGAGNGRTVVSVISQLEKIESLDLFVSADCTYNGEFSQATFPNLEKVRINFAKNAECQPAVEALTCDLLAAAAASLRALTASTTGKALPPPLEEAALRCARLERLNAPFRDTSLLAMAGLARLREAVLFLHPHQPEETDDEAVACLVAALRLCAGLAALRLARLYVYCYQARPETQRLCGQLVAEQQTQRPDVRLAFRLI